MKKTSINTSDPMTKEVEKRYLTHWRINLYYKASPTSQLLNLKKHSDYYGSENIKQLSLY
ncbi:hypothetical protein ACSVDA_14170 [Cytobacillus sp. Hm23]